MERFERLGAYQVTERLDAGGLTETYKAHDREGRPVAICVLHPPDSEAEAEACRMAEAASLIRHPHLEQVLGWSKEPEGLCVISEFLPGVNLRTLVSMYGPLSCAKLALFGSQVARALAELHAHGLVHGKVRARNILLTPTGDEVKLAGLATVSLREGAEATSDIFALGMTLRELAGKPALHQVGDAVSGGGEPCVPQESDRWWPALPPAMEGVIRRATHLDPAERFASAEEVAQALAALVPEEVAG